MKDYQLYLEKIVNALSRAGISYPAPSFTTYEGMWSYVEGLGSFLEMNAQLQKSGAGVVLMGLEESTTFKTYWNSEFYQEFQERKLLESKISSENEESEFQEDYAESLVTQEAENLTETASSEDHLTKVVTGVATGLVVGSVASSSNGLDMSNVIFSDDDDEDEEDSEYEEEPLIEEGDFDLDEEDKVSNSDLGTSGFDMSNVVFSDDEDDDEEDDFVEDDSSDDFYDVDFEEDTSDEDDFEEEEFVNDSNEEYLHGVSKEELTGYDFGNVIFSNDEDDEEDSLSDNEEEYEYDEDGFIIDNSEPEEEDEEDDFIEEEEDGYEYDEDGFIIDRSEPEEDDDEDGEFFEDTSDGYTYDEDGFVIDDDEPIIEDEDDDFEEDEDNFEDNVVPIQPHQVNPTKETVSKPKPVRPKELQETDKILSIFGSLEGKLRKKVKDVKEKYKN